MHFQFFTIHLYLLLLALTSYCSANDVNFAAEHAKLLLKKAVEIPLTNTDLYDELVKYSKYTSAAYCLSTIQSVKLGQLNKACNGLACAGADKDLYVVDIVGGLADALILIDNKTEDIIISFEGSISLVDWMVDFTFLPVEYKPYMVEKGLNKIPYNIEKGKGRVHLGFSLAIKDFFDNSLDAIRELTLQKYPHYNLRVAGHSLGGALATLAGVELKLMGLEPMVINYAAPKVFNPKVANWVDELFDTQSYMQQVKLQQVNKLDTNTLTRVTHVNDPVPCVPFAIMGYDHVGVEFHISEPGLPQPINDVTIRGEFQMEFEIDTIGDLLKSFALDFYGTLKKSLLVSAHLYYFSLQSECNKLGDIIGI